MVRQKKSQYGEQNTCMHVSEICEFSLKQGETITSHGPIPHSLSRPRNISKYGQTQFLGGLIIDVLVTVLISCLTNICLRQKIRLLIDLF